MWRLDRLSYGPDDDPEYIEDPEPVVRIEGAASDGRTLCRDCGEEPDDDGAGHAQGCPEEGTPAAELTHPVSWLNSAHVAMDQDSVVVGISVDDPRGFHTMRVQAGPGGTLYLETPSPADSYPHTGLRYLREGYYEVEDVGDEERQQERKAHGRAREAAVRLVDALSDMRELAVLARERLGGPIIEEEGGPEAEREALEEATDVLERVYGSDWWRHVGGQL